MTIHRTKLPPMQSDPGLLKWAVKNGTIDPVLSGPLIARERPSEIPVSMVPATRTKVWQLGASLHCSIIGTCLTTGELRAMLRKFGTLPNTDSVDDHEIHGIAVGAILQRGQLAKQIQKLLDQRHKSAITRISKLQTDTELREAWAGARREGDIPGFYWAILSHPATSFELVKQVFSDVHMLSHLVGAANRADIRRLSQLEQEKAVLEDRLQRQQAQLHASITTRDAQIRELTQLLGARISHQTNVRVNDERTEISALNRLVGEIRKQLDAEIRWHERAQRKLDELVAARATDEERYRAMEAENAALQAEVAALEAQLVVPVAETGTALHLTGRTIFYVGGQMHHVPRLRSVVEQAGGQFIHHDGGVEEQATLIPGLVNRADVSVFPVDCISHSAALMVKRHCRQVGKPFMPLRSASVASLAHGLQVFQASLGMQASGGVRASRSSTTARFDDGVLASESPLILRRM